MTINQQADPLIGQLVDGRYRVRARIARGGMATVYVATDLRLERRIALKVMHGHLSDDSVFQSRFIQEARAAARLADPHVVNVYDQGQDGDLAYLVMEYLPGITLRELLREQRRLDLEQTITVMDAVLAGLAAAHNAGIVHRDVKPENVLLAEDGRIKIGDFGLARATSANTATGQQLLGTIAYLSPELVTRGTADERSDIYALGIMLYEMLTGEQPYRGEQPMQIAYQHATESVPRPSIRNANVPEQLDELVLWATEKDPDERPADAQAMLDRLREIQQELGVTPRATPQITPTGPSMTLRDSGEVTKLLPGTLGQTEPTVTVQEQDDNAARLRRRTQRRRSRGAWLVLLVLLLTAAAGGVGWWFGSGPGSLIAVPAVSGLSTEAATAELVGAGLLTAETGEHTLDVEAGHVIRTDPGEGERVERDSTVTLIVSLGPALHAIEPLKGRPAAEIHTELAALDIIVTDDVPLFSFDTPTDAVIDSAVTPASGGEVYACDEGCEIYAGDTVALRVSIGPIPDVAGQSVTDATAVLEDAGLQVSAETSEVFDGDVTAGVVIGLADRAEPGNWRPGDVVQLVVSKGPEPIAIPGNLRDKTVREAVRTLRNLGFEVNAGIANLDLPLGAGGYWDVYRVCSVSPSGSALPGATITITPRGPFQSC